MPFDFKSSARISVFSNVQFHVQLPSVPIRPGPPFDLSSISVDLLEDITDAWDLHPHLAQNPTLLLDVIPVDACPTPQRSDLLRLTEAPISGLTPRLPVPGVRWYERWPSQKHQAIGVEPPSPLLLKLRPNDHR
jgi:hypothetical protein